MVGFCAIIDKFQTTGVDQKNSCITIPNKLEKSGTNVDTADVNLVNAIKKQYVANIIYIIISMFGINPYIIQIPLAITKRKIETNELPINDNIGIISIGNTTFFTKYEYPLIELLAPIIHHLYTSTLPFLA